LCGVQLECFYLLIECLEDKVTTNCPFCNENIEFENNISPDLYEVHCRRCGNYSITGSAIMLLDTRANSISKRQRANISGWLNENRGYTIFGADELNPLLQIKTPSFHERADKLLSALETKTEYLGQGIILQNDFLSASWCQDRGELTEILAFLRETKRTAPLVAENAEKILPAGWEYIEKLKRVNVDSQQGFVAMWFNEEMQSVYDNAIAIGIEDAGYRPHLVNLREHNDKIDDEIIAQIRKSRFVLADFTGHRGGVYFEAGFAKGLHLEVIWTCRKDQLNDLHFDIRQYNCIDWEPDKFTEFSKRITYRIESVLGRGTFKK
jgi:hypothetical protein